MLKGMTCKALLGWIRHHAVEPWGDIAAGLRTGFLALATGDCDPEKVSAEDFIVASPTPGQEREREQLRQQIEEFNSEARKRRIERGR